MLSLLPLIASIIAPLVSAQPNIVIFYIDDLDFDEVPIYDYRKFPSYTTAAENGFYPQNKDSDLKFDAPKQHMPHLEALAASGVVLDRYYATSAVCTPSRYSLLTGKYASRAPDFVANHTETGYGNLQWNVALLPSEDNIAKQLKKLGYHTGFFGKWHNGIPVGNEAGFVKTTDEYDIALDYMQRGFGFDVVDRVQFANPMPHNLEWIAEGALQFIQEREPEDPFFLYMALPVPHHQYLRNMMSDDVTAIPTPYGHLAHKPQGMPSRESVVERALAAGVSEREVIATWIDDCVGVIMSELEDRGALENTMVLFISDHQTRGKFNNYEGARVPAVISWPAGFEGGGRIDALLSNIDIYSTLIEAAGGQVPAEETIDGQSILGVLEGTEDSVREGLMLEIHHSRALVTKQWKYIANRVPEDVQLLLDSEAAKVAEEGGYRRIGWHGLDNWHDFEKGVIFDGEFNFPHFFDPDQLYDLDQDMFEQESLYGNPEYSEVQRRLKAMLADELKRLPHRFDL